jgi:hypothetical protein
VAIIKKQRFHCILVLSGVCAFYALNPMTAGDIQWPVFGRDTVLVWKIWNQKATSDFVVRIAEFSPNRFLEWEDNATQGTVFMPFNDILEAKGFSSSIFEAGIDIRTRNVTTLWLSQRVFKDLKAKNRARCEIDRVSSWITVIGTGQLTIEVNHSPMIFPVIRVQDDRKSEMWFLDQEENPLIVQHLVRQYRQTLTSITTNRPNTLRWIKGKKLARSPQ